MDVLAEVNFRYGLQCENVLCLLYYLRDLRLVTDERTLFFDLFSVGALLLEEYFDHHAWPMNFYF